jgi:predicted type IV restriction endonuclease
MSAIPAKVEARVKGEVKRYRSIIDSAKQRDVNEADTSVIVTSVLCDILGWDRFTDITREYCVRNTFCDLAVKVDGKVKIFIEVKAIGFSLKDTHLRQVVDYATKEGVDWVILTNAAIWKVYKVLYEKPINQQEVFEVDLLDTTVRPASLVDKLYLISKEGVSKSAIASYHEAKQATSRFMIAATLLSEPVVEALRREIRRVSGGVRLETEELQDILRAEVLKRDVFEGDQAKEATDRVRRASAKLLKRPTADPKLVLETAAPDPAEVPEG